MNMMRRNPLFRKLMTAGAVSTLGDSIYYIALVTYASGFAHPAKAIMLISLSETLPGVLYLVMGVLSDRTAGKAGRLYATYWWRGIGCLMTGLLIGVNASWLVLCAIACLNFLSDLVGKYAASLQFPLVVRIVRDEELEQASGWLSAVQRVMGILSQLAGSFLIMWFSYRTLAWLNGAAFAAGGLVLGSILKRLHQLEGAVETGTQEEGRKWGGAGLWKQSLHSCRTLFQNGKIFPVVLQVTLINAVLFPLSSLFAMFAASDGEFVVRSFSFTVAIFSGMGSIGVIAGNLLAGSLCRSMSMTRIVGWSYGAVLGFCLGLFLGLPIMVLSMYFMACASVGVLSPKYGAMFARNVEREQLASVTGASQTLGHLGGPLSHMMVGGIASGWSLYAGTWMLAGMVLAGLGLHLASTRRRRAQARGY